VKYVQAATVAMLMLLVAGAQAWTQDVTGTWKASFDTQIGRMDYTYTFAVKDATLTGKIQSEMGGTTDVIDGKVDGDKVSFVEIFKYQGAEIRISYSGKVTSADEIRFTRQVAEFATEEVVAKRVK
jgi:hypothetical protein